MAHQQFALLSIVYMMSFVALFDSLHVDRWRTRFCKDALMTQDDAQRLVRILSASLG